MKEHWQLESSIDAIIFDCDSTLSSIEGIDELAKASGTEKAVETLTNIAMNKTGINPDLYRTRLEMVKPSYENMIELGHLYYNRLVPDAKEVLAIFKRLKKNIFLLSSGLYPSIKIFGELLKIQSNNIYAVDIYFDAEGTYKNFDADSPLVHAQGKKTITEVIKKQYPTLLHVGDGLNDLVTQSVVTRFVGFGGVVYRENVANECDFYIQSLVGLLPLTLTKQEVALLTEDEKRFYDKGLAAIC